MLSSCFYRISELAGDEEQLKLEIDEALEEIDKVIQLFVPPFLRVCINFYYIYVVSVQEQMFLTQFTLGIAIYFYALYCTALLNEAGHF